MMNAITIVLTMNMFVSVIAFTGIQAIKQSSVISIVQMNSKHLFQSHTYTPNMNKESSVTLFASTFADIQKPSPIKRFVETFKTFLTNVFENMKKFFKRSDSKTNELSMFKIASSSVQATSKLGAGNIGIDDSNILEARRIVENDVTGTDVFTTAIDGINSGVTLPQAMHKLGLSFNEFNVKFMKRIEQVDMIVAKAVEENIKQHFITAPVIQIVSVSKPMSRGTVFFAVPEYMQVEYGPIDPFTSL